MHHELVEGLVMHTPRRDKRLGPPQGLREKRKRGAEGVGFEPTKRIAPLTGFQDQRHRPLGEPSRATVVDGKSSRYKMIVPEECVFDRHEAAHAISLFDMDKKYADVVGLHGVVRRHA